MKILVYSGFAPYWGQYEPSVLASPDGGALGGGEAAFLQTTSGLAMRGHEVVACHPGQPGHWRGAQFTHVGNFESLLRSRDWDGVLSWSDARPLRSPGVPPRAGRVFAQQLNDLNQGTEDIDVVVSPSKTHAAYLRFLIPSGQPIPEFCVSGAGVTCEYPEAIIWPRDPIVSYWSSPDRGLVHLLRVWPRVKRVVTNARLWIFYEIHRWLQLCDAAYGIADSYFGWYRHQGEIVKQLLADVAHLDVTVHGAKPRKVLAQYQQKSRIWCYPLDNGANFVEGFCVSMLEALAAGCWPITSPVDALPELYKDMAGDWIKRGDEDQLCDTLIQRLLHPPAYELFKDRNFEVAKQHNWEAATLDMEIALTRAAELRQ